MVFFFFELKFIPPVNRDIHERLNLAADGNRTLSDHF